MQKYSNLEGFPPLKSAPCLGLVSDNDVISIGQFHQSSWNRGLGPGEALVFFTFSPARGVVVFFFGVIHSPERMRCY